MSTLDQLRDGMQRAWDGIAEGWNQLRERTSSALTRFQPVRSAGDLETVKEQVMAGSSRWGLLAAEVSEGEKEVTVRLEVPGMEPGDFDVTVADGRYLVVRGEKHAEHEARHGRFHVMERAYGRFERAVPLPAEVSEEGCKARYRRGVLRVSLPKVRSGGGRRIDIQS